MARKQMTAVQPDQTYRDENGNEIIWRGRESKNSVVMFGARNCTVIIEKGVKLDNAKIRLFCEGGRVVIGENSTYKGVMAVGLNSSITIGKKLTVTDGCNITAAEGASVTIGDDCMFAKDNAIMADDHHPIFDLKTGQRVNPSRSVVIGDHVWLALRAVVLSGSNVGSNSVVGLGSVVKGSFPAHAIIAGVPAKVVKEGIQWEKHSIYNAPPYDFPGPITFIPTEQKSVAQRVQALSSSAMRFLSSFTSFRRRGTNLE